MVPRSPMRVVARYSTNFAGIEKLLLLPSYGIDLKFRHNQYSRENRRRNDCCQPARCDYPPSDRADRHGPERYPGYGGSLNAEPAVGIRKYWCGGGPCECTHNL